MEEIKEAFTRVKQDIISLARELGEIKLQMHELKDVMLNLTDIIDRLRIEQIQKEQDLLLNNDNIRENIQNQLKSLEENQQKLKEEQKTLIHDIKNELESSIRELNFSILELKSNIPTIQHINPTQTPQIPTDKQTPTHTPTDNYALQGVISHFNNISIGNEGVPTDRQADRQTNQQTQNNIKTHDETPVNPSEILSSLDSFRKGIRLKFKRLTQQEMLVFSTIYTLEEQGEVDYLKLADTLKLSESSVRDYIHKLVSKGIPIDKEKINNKRVLLHISKDLKKIVSLNSIIKLREI